MSSARHNGRSSQSPKRLAPARRGSVLIVALIFAALIALALGTLLSLNLNSSRLAQRSFHSYAALNLGEAGLEEGVWSFNRAARGDAAAWSNWTHSEGAAWQKFTNFNFAPGGDRWVKVYVNSYNPPAGIQPKIIALASVNSSGEPEVTKMLEVTLRRRSYFANGLVAKESVVFNGVNTSLDSWNSDPDGNPLTPPVDYNATVRLETGSVASSSTTNTAVVINQAQIWGYVATGGAQPQVGPLGTIRGAGTPVGVAIDPSRISTDFNAEFPAIAMPADGTPIFTLGPTLGTFGVATRWRCPAVSLSGNQTLTIQGDVTLIITATAGTSGFSVTGNAQVIVPAGSSLTLYTESDVKIAGRGLVNNNVQPISFTLWGTNQTTAGQDMQIAGNGALRGVVYAPEGNVKINGNGDVMGSIVARNITLVGNAAFHYDESLASTGTNAPFGIAKWRELNSSTDRDQYLPLFNGW